MPHRFGLQTEDPVGYKPARAKSGVSQSEFKKKKASKQFKNSPNETESDSHNTTSGKRQVVKSAKFGGHTGSFSQVNSSSNESGSLKKRKKNWK